MLWSYVKKLFLLYFLPKSGEFCFDLETKCPGRYGYTGGAVGRRPGSTPPRVSPPLVVLLSSLPINVALRDLSVWLEVKQKIRSSDFFF